MELPDFRVDFVDRTIEIIDKLSKKTDYEVTLLINCLFGLIVIPTEVDYAEYHANYEEDFVNFCIEKLNQYRPSIQQKIPDDLNIPAERLLVRCMKNALSHLNIETTSEDGKISAVKFKDRLDKRSEFHTEIEFTVDDLKQFALDMARHYSNIIQKRKRAK